MCVSPMTVYSFFPCLPRYSASVFDVINVSVFAGLRLLTVVSGQHLPSLQ